MLSLIALPLAVITIVFVPLLFGGAAIILFSVGKSVARNRSGPSRSSSRSC
ncbi:hypothetical protein [Cellulomonas hominis]|uniref:hypothetical protein n=1 Tax=Cellulomonas hominis TaxID=156981 RepID=UPI001BCCF354|nr:hypothetical protein [Cellulomonas hominis]